MTDNLSGTTVTYDLTSAIMTDNLSGTILTYDLTSAIMTYDFNVS